MGLFTNKSAVVVEESVLSDETVFEFAQEVTAETGYVLVAEAEENWNNIMKAVGIHELNVLEATGSEVIYEANDVKSFLEKIKDFFKMIWEKIVAVFKKFFAMIDSWIKSDKDFVKRYEKALKGMTNTKDFKFKGFKYTVDKVSVKDAANKTKSVFAGIVPGYDNQAAADSLVQLSDPSKFEDIIGEFDKKDEYIEKARAAIVGATGTMDSKEFNEELSKKLRNGEDSKDEYGLSDLGGINEILSAISGAADAKKAAEGEYKELKRLIDALIKKIDKWKGEFDKAVDNNNLSSIAAKYSSLLKDDLALLQIVNTAKLQAIKEENRQAKAICVKLLTYKPKNESVTHYGESGSFLDGVVLR